MSIDYDDRENDSRSNDYSYRNYSIKILVIDKWSFYLSPDLWPTTDQVREIERLMSIFNLLDEGEPVTENLPKPPP